MSWFLSGTYGFVVLAFYFSYRTALSPRQNILLGIRLPAEHLNHPAVLSLAGQYRMAIRRLLWLELVSLLLFPVCEYLLRADWLLLFSLVWIIVVVYLNQALYGRFVGKLYALKTNMGWLVGQTRSTILVDTAVSSSRNRFPVPLWIMLLPVLITVIAQAAVVTDRLPLPGTPDDTWKIMTGLPLCVHAALLFCYYGVCQESSRVYSRDAGQNLLLNRIRKQTATRGLFAASVVNTLGLLLPLYVKIQYPETSVTFLFYLFSIISVCILIGTFFHTGRKQDILLSNGQEEVLTDEDYYWRKGYYCNPNDPSIMVSKRTGCGMELNMANKKGIALMAAMAVPGLLLVLWLVVIPVIRLQFTDFGLERKEDTISVLSPSYASEFQLNQIEEISLINALPKHATRTNGMNTGTWLTGHFFCSEYGNGMWYLYTRQPTAVLIRLNGRHVLINRKTEEGTRALYEQLTQWVEDNGTEEHKIRSGTDSHVDVRAALPESA